MAAKAKGPFDLEWGDNVLQEVEEIDTEYDVDSEDYQTVQGQTFELDGPTKATITLTLLATDVAALAALLPQFHVANGGVMSTGETVNNADGAIDLNANCDDEAVYNDLDIISCANPGQVFRLVNARTRLDGVDFDNKIRKVMVKFIGEPAQGDANVQFFKEGTINVVS